jgi:hypothetical protein
MRDSNPRPRAPKARALPDCANRRNLRPVSPQGHPLARQYKLLTGLADWTFQGHPVARQYEPVVRSDHKSDKAFVMVHPAEAGSHAQPSLLTQ